MIVYNLICTNDHRFEGWFGSGADFERQQQSSLLSCPVCGTSQVSKTVHATYINSGDAQPSGERPHRRENAKAQYSNLTNEILSRVVDYVIANTADVGDAFPEEARKIHYEEAPERKIRGNATPRQVKELQDEGIEVLALPIPAYRLNKSH